MVYSSKRFLPSVLYEVVSNVPKSSAELEDRESLAVMAASGQDLKTEDAADNNSDILPADLDFLDWTGSLTR